MFCGWELSEGEDRVAGVGGRRLCLPCARHIGTAVAKYDADRPPPPVVGRTQPHSLEKLLEMSTARVAESKSKKVKKRRSG